MRSRVPDALYINDTDDHSVMTPVVPTPQKTNPSAKSMFKSSRTQDFVVAMNKRRMDKKENSADGKAAMVRIPRNDVPPVENVKNTVLVV